MSVLNSHPIAAAIAVALVGLGGLVAADWKMTPVLHVPAVSAVGAPKLDGDTSDAAWLNAVPVTVLTAHGGDFGGSGETRIEVRAVHDNSNIYFAFVWDDPTRSLERLPLIKEEGAWRLIETRANSATEDRYYDDRLAIMLARSGRALIGGAIHLGLEPLKDGPRPATGRGLHYTSADAPLDVWEWSAGPGALTQRLQDSYLGPPLKPTKEQLAGTARYPGGFSVDPGGRVTTSNFAVVNVEGTGRTVKPLHLPKMSPVKPLAVHLDKTEQQSDTKDEEKMWALSKSRSQPYSAVADAQIPDGTVIPGIVVNDAVEAGPQDVIGRGGWSGGRWVLEVKRSLGASDKDVAISSGTLMWLAAFDHSQTRHTYHLRPLELEIE